MVITSGQKPLNKSSLLDLYELTRKQNKKTVTDTIQPNHKEPFNIITISSKRLKNIPQNMV